VRGGSAQSERRAGVGLLTYALAGVRVQGTSYDAYAKALNDNTTECSLIASRCAPRGFLQDAPVQRRAPRARAAPPRARPSMAAPAGCGGAPAPHPRGVGPPDPRPCRRYGFTALRREGAGGSRTATAMSLAYCPLRLHWASTISARCTGVPSAMRETRQPRSV
jgi:hypothetical protein